MSRWIRSLGGTSTSGVLAALGVFAIAPGSGPAVRPDESVRVSTAAPAAPQLPRIVPPASDPYPDKPCTISPRSGANLSSELARARGGAVVCLTGTYGPFELPARAANDTGWIVVRSANGLPAPGTRMRPSLAAGLAKIVAGRKATPALTTAPQTYGYYIRGVEFTVGPTVTLTYGLVLLGDGTSAVQTLVSQLPQRIVLAQVYAHGTATGEMQRCVALNAGAVAIVDSWLSNCHGKGYDTQAIGGWNGTGPYLIENNYLEGAGENVLLGGAAPGSAALEAGDVTIRHNHFRTPASWKGVWTKKNLLELKVAHRVLIEANVFDGSWTDAQTGFAVLFKSSPDGPYPGMNTTDVTFRYNWLTNVGAGISISGRENYQTPAYVGLYPNDRTSRILIEQNWLDSVNVAPYSGAGRLVAIGGIAHATEDVTLRRNTFTTPGPLTHLLAMGDQAPSVDRLLMDANVFSEGQYGVYSPSGFGKAALDGFAAGYTFSNNVVVRGGGNWVYPPGTALVRSRPPNAGGAGADRSVIAAKTRDVIVPP